MKTKLVIMLVAFLLVSCYEDEQLVDYDYANGQTLIFIPPLGEKVDSVIYSWDGNKIATETTMPFILHYKLQNQSSGTHTLEYRVVSVTRNENVSSWSSYSSKKEYIIK